MLLLIPTLRIKCAYLGRHSTPHGHPERVLLRWDISHAAAHIEDARRCC